MRMLRFGRFFNVISRPLMRAMFKGPKRENTDESLDYAAVYKAAMERLRSFSLSGWRDGMAYMAGHSGPQNGDFRGIRGSFYLKCTGDNETVKQPDAADTWKQAATLEGQDESILEIKDVKAAHCSYSEQPRLWNEALAAASR